VEFPCPYPLSLFFRNRVAQDQLGGNIKSQVLLAASFLFAELLPTLSPEWPPDILPEHGLLLVKMLPPQGCHVYRLEIVGLLATDCRFRNQNAFACAALWNPSGTTGFR
jgi:hypothetical protein